MDKVSRGLCAAVSLCALWAMPAFGKTIVVSAGGSIRAALAQAAPGDRVQVMPGVYREGAPGELNALTITRHDIDLTGMGTPQRPVVLENAGGQPYGIWVSPPDSVGAAAQEDYEHPPCGDSGARIQRFRLSGFTVRGFAEHGVHLACVDDFVLERNHADGNGEYGLFPIASSRGRIVANEVTGTPLDAGIYVGQSRDVDVVGNHVHGNLLGIEVENCVDCNVLGNRVHDNSFGIFVDLLPFLQRKQQTGSLISGNEVYHNNRPNSAEPGGLLAVLPPGIGILLSGADRTRVIGNTVTGNQFAGIGIGSVCLSFALLGLPCEGLDIEPNPDGNRVIGNLVIGNATVPSPDPLLDRLRADLVWDGSGSHNCWRGNHHASSVPPQLPPCTRP
jgi:parallel beta-helix repeat protein